MKTLSSVRSKNLPIPDGNILGVLRDNRKLIMFIKKMECWEQLKSNGMRRKKNKLSKTFIENYQPQKTFFINRENFPQLLLENVF